MILTLSSSCIPEFVHYDLAYTIFAGGLPETLESETGYHARGVRQVEAGVYTSPPNRTFAQPYR